MIFIKKNFRVTQIVKCLTVYSYLYQQNQHDFNQKILKKKRKKYIFMKVDEKMKHLAKKSFIAINGVWRWSIEHTTTFCGQIIFFIFFILFFFLSMYMKNVFLLLYFMIFKNKFCWFCQYGWFFTERPFNICVTIQFFLIINGNNLQLPKIPLQGPSSLWGPPD